MTTFPTYLLREHPPGSHECLDYHRVEVPDGEPQPAKHIESIALTRIKSLLGFPSLKSSEVVKCKIYVSLEPIQGRLLSEKRVLAAGAANRGELGSGSFPLLDENETFDGTTHYDLIIVFEISLCFKFVMLEEKSRSSYDNFGSGSVVTFPEDSIQTIYDAARSLIARGLPIHENVATIDKLCLYELKSQSEKQYERFLDTEQLEPGLLGRSLTIIHGPEGKLGNIKTQNLVFAFTATRSRRLWIPYVLFSSGSEPYQFVGKHLFEASSGDTVGLLHDAIDVHIRSFPIYDRETRYKVVVYEPREAFESAYNKQPDELESLKLEKKYFSGSTCSVLLPLDKLSIWREGQTLVIVFGIPVQSQAPSVSTSILDSLRHLRITKEAPSVAAKLENYSKSQKNYRKGILDDRPGKDDLIAPIPLLYQPFGHFRDIRCGVKAPGEGDIHEGELREKVDALADAMTMFHESKEERRSKFVKHLEAIFRVPPGSINSSKIPSGQTISDGHVNGEHGAMVFCLECENELSAASCEPIAKLISYIATSFQSRADDHPEPFRRWRVPALGVTLVGPNVQFFGVVWVGQMRVVPLTLPLPMVDPTGEEFRWALFLAFKAAFIVFSQIKTDAYNLVQVLRGPPKDWPPVITTETGYFPSVTEIDIETEASPKLQPEKIKFVLDSRHDDVEHRHLYHAHLISPASETGRVIYVKFSQRYSVELHRFCALRGLAPKILGSQRLSGGWFAVAMEKIDTLNQKISRSIPEARKWGRDLEGLVNGFHQQGLVHGDLRLANLVITNDGGRRKVLLVDFDWGGKEGEVVFPHERLNEELGISNDQLWNRRITKAHDRKCLSVVLEALGCPPLAAGVDTMVPDQEVDR